ncbi:uncharacterized protein LOC111106564 [Crassostrea virginica]
MENDGRVTQTERRRSESYTDDNILSELDGIWHRTTESREIEALFQMLKAELLSNEGDKQSTNNYFSDQMLSSNKDSNNDLLDEIFGETPPTEWVSQADAMEDSQSVLLDFDCSVLECKPVVDDNSNFICNQDSDLRVVSHV